ncbi:DUF4925 domain-containing protein [Phocaeicola massiliensis]|uniref:DUF4925 domain-containing protein n=1 Tax=Phocaeicola massiliensis TaxID=204516 RepID=UPI0022E6BD7D|nr:DUF4925 domain-containing protein [Phocaeicola massiliensis]
MKKNLFYYLFAVICTIGLFTSCSDDDEKVVNPIPQTTFNSENGLQLTYNGAPLLGKKVTFTPDATEATKATLRLEGEFDLAGILKGQRSNMTSPTGPGVFPGSPVTTLSVDLSINGNQCTFSGVSETEYCTFSYAGKVTAGTMDLSFTDVTLKNTALAGTVWKPTPLANTEDGGMDEPIHFVWKFGTKAAIEIFGHPSEIEINDLLLLALRFPLFDDGSGDRVSVEQMLCSVLKDVTLGADGNIVATYMDAANGGTEWVTSPSNMAQYVVTGDNQLLLFLNPQAIMANVDNVEKSVRTVDVGAILQQAIAELYPMLINGVPLTYTKEGNRMKVFLGTDLLLPLMKNIVAPLFEDEEFLNMVIEAMKSDPQFGGMAGMMVPTLKLLPEIIKNTTQLEIGLDLTQVK